MKHLRRFDEELSPGVLNRAAEGKAKIHGDVEAAKTLRDWAKKSESGGKGYDIVYTCVREGRPLYTGIEYTANMVKPTVAGVFFGSVLEYQKNIIGGNTADSILVDWKSGSRSLSVSMVVNFEKTEVVDRSWTYEVTIIGSKIGEANDQVQTFNIKKEHEHSALTELGQNIKAAYPKIIGSPLRSDAVRWKLVKGPTLGVVKGGEMMSKIKGVGWSSGFQDYTSTLSTFVIEVRLSRSTYGMADQYACGACGGAVTMDCYECDGEGTIWSDEADDEVPCTVCNGTGTITCEECNGEDMTAKVSPFKFFEDTFYPEVTMRPIPGKQNYNRDEVYSQYPWVGMFRTRDDARRFLDDNWERLINEDPRSKYGKNGGVGSFYEAITDLVKEAVDVNDNKAMDYMQEAIVAVENISVGAMVQDKDAKLAVESANRNFRNISTYRPKNK